MIGQNAKEAQTIEVWRLQGCTAGRSEEDDGCKSPKTAGYTKAFGDRD